MNGRLSTQPEISSSGRLAASWQLIVVQLVLAALVWAVFGQTLGHQFVEYDDQNYVYQNSRITGGVSLDGLAAAFTQLHARNWHPLTTISHMVDCQFFGLNPAGHHLVNVLLHTAAVLLLFSVLNAMTGAMWRSAIVAAVFAIHPLRAESVAWVAERKDVVSAVFFMLTLCAYVRYVRRPSVKAYLGMTGLFCMGLMCKPTLVTMPFLLLLLDYWPLNRFGAAGPWPVGVQSGKIGDFRLSGVRLVIEKLPLGILSLAGAVMTILAQKSTVQYSQHVPLPERMSNAAVSTLTYIGQMLWPANLAVFYPDAADRLTAASVVLAIVVLSAVTLVVCWKRRGQPYLLIGWGWYLIGLLPVIGIVQVGLQGRADRYTYLPQIGLCLALVWMVAELRVMSRRVSQCITGASIGAMIAILAWKGAIQTSHWKNTESLWQHALAVTENNDVAHYNMASLLMRRGQIDDAITHYAAALRAGADRETYNHLSPAIIENSLGNAYAAKSDLDSAIAHYRRACGLRQNFPDAVANLAAMLARTGRIAEAISEYQTAVSLPPEDAPSHQRLGALLVQANRSREAVAHYRRAVEIAPDSVDSLNALAWILANSSDPAVRYGPEALLLAEHANRLTGGKDPVVLRVLAAAYEACGRPNDAFAVAQEAASLSRNNPALTRALTEELKLYRAAVAQMGFGSTE